MKWYLPFAFALAVFALLATVWLLDLAHLTRARGHACMGIAPVNQVEKISPVSRVLQKHINDTSSRKGGIGLQATVIFSGGAAWTGVAGYADLGKQCPMTVRHYLYLGSMTKLFTAALVMQQVESGALNLNDPLSHWFPSFNTEPITLRNLLNHTSGLPDYARNTWFQVRWFGLPRKTWRPDELARGLQVSPLHFHPGSRHEYSNSNYLLLGMILEKAAGKPYAEILDGNILVKLGLHDTYYLTYPDDLPVANGYDETLLRLGRRDVTGFRRSLESGAYAAGGIQSTSQDTARYVHALFTGQVLSGSSLAEMKAFIAAPEVDLPEQTGYGLGIRRLVIDGEVLMGHTGSIPGYSGIAMYNEQKGYTIVVLSNLSIIEQVKLSGELQETVLEYLLDAGSRQ